MPKRNMPEKISPLQEKRAARLDAQKREVDPTNIAPSDEDALL